MEFTQVNFGSSGRLSGERCGYLVGDNWDDHGFKTTFTVIIFDDDGIRYEPGAVAIMTYGMTEGRVEVPEKFDSLDKQYCSLGQGQNYYETIAELPFDIRTEFLKGMRDCVHHPAIWARFRDQRAMEVSLLRADPRRC